MGKFGSMVVLSRSKSPDNQLSAEDLGRQLCQHIVGMNPKTIGSLEEEEQRNTAEVGHAEQFVEAEQVSVAVGNGADIVSSPSESDACDDEVSKKASDEARFVFQDFLMDESLTVGELLRQNSAEVTDFVRFGCGEVLEGEEDVGV